MIIRITDALTSYVVDTSLIRKFYRGRDGRVVIQFVFGPVEVLSPSFSELDYLFRFIEVEDDSDQVL